MATKCHWVGPPIHITEDNVLHYRACRIAAVEYALSDCVYLQPAESGISPYICRIMDMFQPPQPPSLPFPAVHLTDTPTDTPTQNKQEITVSWYYRPQELDLDGDLLIYENEIFSSDDTTSISPDSIIGKCYVITPAEYCRMTSTPRNLQKMQNTFLCSKKYIPSEGRVVPLDSSGEVEMTQLPRKFLLRNKLVFPLYRQRQLEPVGPSTTTPALATSHAGGGAPRTLSHSKRGRAPTKTPAPTIAAPATTAATTAATTVTAATAPSGRRSPSRRRRKTREQYSPEPFPAWHAGLSLPITTQQAVSAADAAHPSPPGSALGGPIESGEMAAAAAGGGGGGGRTPTFGGSGTPRSRAGRWSQERYDAAQRSLVNILRSLGAINAHKAILRPTLRDEARKLIGDTGLLDNQLRWLTDQVVTPEGERLRRRHNREGHMEYWLQSPQAAEAEEAMLQDEMQALSSELREIKEARHVLQAVRTEAATAIQAVSEIKEHPEEAAQTIAGTLGAVPAPQEVTHRMDVIEQGSADLLRRIYHAEELAMNEIEKVRQESSEAGRLIAENINSFTAIAANIQNRCKVLETQASLTAEAAVGQFEALSAALGDHYQLRKELEARNETIKELQQQVAELQRMVLTLVPMSTLSQGASEDARDEAQEQEEEKEEEAIMHGDTTRRKLSNGNEKRKET